MITEQAQILLFVIGCLFLVDIILLIICYKQDRLIWRAGNIIRGLKHDYLSVEAYPSPEDPNRYYVDLEGGIRLVFDDGDIYWYRYDEEPKPAPIEFKVGKTKSKGQKDDKLRENQSDVC
jgi:hypothetical protein